MQNRLRILPLILCAASFVVAAQVQAQVMNTEPASASANANTQAHTQAELHAEVQAIASPPPENDGDADNAGSISGRFQLHAPKSDWATLLREHIPELSGHADPQNITPALIRKLRLDISNILATEGYFSPAIQFNNPNINPATSDATAAVANLKAIVIEVDPGPRTIIENVSIQMHGPLADRIAAGDALAIQRRKAMQEDWGLAVGQVFRDSDWSDAKNQLIENLRADGYAAASISESHARIDAEHHRGILQVDIDSGPMFTLGELQVTGLQRYPAWLLQRYRPPSKGEPYSRGRLLEFQRLLQNSPYFASVAVSVDPDPAKSDAVAIDVHVVERKARDLSFGLGYSSNTGFRSEVAYRDRDLTGNAWDLRSAIRIEQRRQLGYADIYLPPRASNYLDSFGVLFDRQDVSGVISNRHAVGVKRTSTRGHLEQRLGLNLSREKIELEGEPLVTSKALVASIGWTWRDVDDAFAPRRGQIYQLELAFADKLLLSDQRFFRTYGKYQRWIPVGKSDSIILRAEAGQVFSQSIDGIPEDYLFRTGGSTTVRGYAYQSLGLQHPTGVTGGRVMTAMSAEYLHWINPTWGAAAFVDNGDAAASWRDVNMHQGVGVGGRYRTPAGPVALDMTYGRQSKRVRLDLSIAIAF